MRQTKKGNQWYFGMKAHLGMDSRTKLIHAVAATPANVADSTVLPELLHGQETRVWGDQAYRGQPAVIREHAPKARDFTNRLIMRRHLLRCQGAQYVRNPADKCPDTPKRHHRALIIPYCGRRKNRHAPHPCAKPLFRPSRH